MENSNKKREKSEEEKREDIELFKRAISEGLSLKFDEIAEELKDIEMPKPSRHYKLEMNRLLREATGGSFIPYPEVYKQH